MSRVRDIAHDELSRGVRSERRRNLARPGVELNPRRPQQGQRAFVLGNVPPNENVSRFGLVSCGTSPSHSDARLASGDLRRAAESRCRPPSPARVK
jgi:hypothetical protein